MFKQGADAGMSDALLFLKVEDLIGVTMGAPEKNTVNFKMLQCILHILARQMRLLEQTVEIQITDGDFQTPTDKGKGHSESDQPSAKRGGKQMDGKDNHQFKVGTSPEKVYRVDKGGVGKGEDKEQEREDKQARRDKGNVEAGAKDKEKGEKSRDKSDKDRGKMSGRRESAGRDERSEHDGKTERSEREGKDERPGTGGREGKSGGGEKDKDIRSKGKSGKENDTGKGRDQTTGDSEAESDESDRGREKDRSKKGRDKAGESPDTVNDRDRSAKGKDKGKSVEDNERTGDSPERDKKRDPSGKDKRRDKDRSKNDRENDESPDRDRDKDQSKKGSDKGGSKKDGGRDESGGTSEKDKVKSGKDRKDDRDEDDTKSIKSKGRSEADTDNSERERGKGKSGDTSEKEGERSGKDKKRETDDDEKSVKSMARSEKDYDGGKDDDTKSGKSTKSERDKKQSTRDGGKTDKDTKRITSGTSIAISERKEKDQKILVVEKGPSTMKDDTTRVGSIEVVTQSQFKLLEQAVRSLEKKAAPMPLPTLPDNKKLREDIAKGSASLTDTMQAMQITARVKAAEEAIGRLTEMTTEIASKGGMPKELIKKAAALQSDVRDIVQEARSAANGPTDTASKNKPDQSKSQTSRKVMLSQGVETTMSHDADAASTRTGGGSLKTIEPPRGQVRGVPSATTSSRVTVSSGGTYGKFVTTQEMDKVLGLFRDDLLARVKEMTGHAHTIAEGAAMIASELLKKMEIAMMIDKRITDLYGVVKDYAEQLSGFDGGLGTQMASFKEQIALLHKDLNGGLEQLAHVTNNAETAALMELHERCEFLDWELKDTLYNHQNLTNFQGHLSEEMRSLVECVEMLREQKADREEVQDGLRDKADSSKLAGLLTENEFKEELREIDMRLQMCHIKFNKQEAAWIQVLKEFAAHIANKAEYLHLVSIKERVQEELQQLHDKQHVLAQILGDPKTAMITRQLAKNGVCATCRVPAVMPPRDATLGAPPRLPPAHAHAPAPAHSDRELCVKDIFPYELDEPPEGKSHMCHRWVGGSHTVVTTAGREHPPPLPVTLAPVRRYIGIGTDSKPYKLEEDLLPCVECIPVTPENIPGEADGPPPPSEVGAGDQVNVIKASDARRVTIVDQGNLREVTEAGRSFKSSTAYIKRDAMTSNSSLVDKENVQTSTTTIVGRERVSTQSMGALGSFTPYDDTPRRATDIGNIVRGRVTNVDENAVRRASIRYDTAMRRATGEAGTMSVMISEGEQHDNSPEKANDQ